MKTLDKRDIKMTVINPTFPPKKMNYQRYKENKNMPEGSK